MLADWDKRTRAVAAEHWCNGNQRVEKSRGDERFASVRNDFAAVPWDFLTDLWLVILFLESKPLFLHVPGGIKNLGINRSYHLH